MSETIRESLPPRESLSPKSNKRRKKFQRSSRACTYCRQKKLKCDAIQKFPNSCSQCQRYKLYCEIDAEFKRSGKLVQPTAATTNPYRAGTPPLAQAMEQDGPPNSHDESHQEPQDMSTQDNETNEFIKDCEGRPAMTTVMHSTGNGPAEQSRRSRYQFLFEKDPLPDINVEGINIPGVKVREMFRVFYSEFYHHLPVFLRDYLDPVLLVGERGLVYWAILTVTSMIVCPEFSRSLADYTRNQLNHAKVKMMTQTFVLNPQMGMSYIIASLTLCTWMVPSPSMHDPQVHTDKTRQNNSNMKIPPVKDDQTWLLCSIATNIGMQMGYHRASYHEEYAPEIDWDNNKDRKIAAASLCWAGLFIINQTNSCITGLPNMAPMNNGIYRHLNRLMPKVPELEAFIAQLRIMQGIRNGIDALGNNSDTEIGLVEPSARGLIHSTVVTNFSQLVSSVGYHDRYTELLFLIGKMQFHSFLLAPDTLEADSRAVAVPLYLVCLKIIKLFKELMAAIPHFRSIPAIYIRAPFFATTLLFGISVSNLAPLIDTIACRNAISDMYNLFKSMDDYFETNLRVMQLIDTMHELHSLGEIEEPVFNIKTRLGASGFISMFIRFKRYLIKENRENCEYSQQNSMADVAFRGCFPVSSTGTKNTLSSSKRADTDTSIVARPSSLTDSTFSGSNASSVNGSMENGYGNGNGPASAEVRPDLSYSGASFQSERSMDSTEDLESMMADILDWQLPTASVNYMF